MNGAATATPLRVGILGHSGIARRKFIPALLKSRGGSLAAIASREPHGESVLHLGYEELVASPEIDLVYVSLPNHLHEPWTIRALDAGKHVICEKPLGLDAASVERMLCCAEHRGLLLYENLTYLLHPQHEAIRELMTGGEIGRVTALRSVFGFPFPAPGDFRLDPSMGGGAFHDLARYPLSTALSYLQGDSYRFRGFSLERDGLNLAMHGVATTSGDEMFSFSMAFGQQYESYCEIIGEQGKIRLERAYTIPPEMTNRLRVLIGSSDASLDVPAEDYFLLGIEQVCTLIRTGGDYRPFHERSRRIARLAEAMKKGCTHGEARE